MSHAMWGHLRWTGHGGEFWQNVVHWWWEWQTTRQYSCLENPMNSMKRQRVMTLKDELPHLVGAEYATGEEWRNSSGKKKRLSQCKNNTQLWMWLVKVWCCKEQYCIGTCNVRSMNQGKLEMVKQEMTRVNINILGINELKWTRMGELNSDGHYI